MRDAGKFQACMDILTSIAIGLKISLALKTMLVQLSTSSKKAQKIYLKPQATIHFVKAW